METETETDIAIGPAGPADVAGIVDLLTELADHYGIAGPVAAGGDPAEAADAVTRLLSGSDPQVRALVARRGGRVVGLASYTYFWPPFGVSIYLKELFVRRDARDHGVGGRLVDALRRQALAEGCVRLELTADSTDAGALRFYGRLGFEPVPDRTLLRLEGDAFGADRPVT
jgi:GNAT superfamily N-acetyltransferase